MRRLWPRHPLVDAAYIAVLWVPSVDLDLLAAYKATGMLAMRNRLVTDNIRLVYTVVYSFTKCKGRNGAPPGGPATDDGPTLLERLNGVIPPPPRRAHPAGWNGPKRHEDLVQAGTLGLMHAIERFDLTRVTYTGRNGSGAANVFKSYATWHILHEIQKAVANERGMSKSVQQQEFTSEDLQDILTGHIREVRPVYGLRNGPKKNSTSNDDKGPVQERYWADSHETAVIASMDAAVATRDSAPDDLAVLEALADGATPAELAAALGMPPGRDAGRVAVERAAGALERARAALGGE